MQTRIAQGSLEGGEEGTLFRQERKKEEDGSQHKTFFPVPVIITGVFQTRAEVVLMNSYFFMSDFCCHSL